MAIVFDVIWIKQIYLTKHILSKIYFFEKLNIAISWLVYTILFLKLLNIILLLLSLALRVGRVFK